ncbi:hypothetical protein UFOVP723_78 [uncultured Caudovirales phage]|uniref:Uncharacterized protein n=1 Tax=uncultured Caudovirales phage TaxID=2100421 RepID=A0A6J5NN39_9CAUD|nr:hypothetical protein UFOVP723_78 [uncultured Caudovirales phage]
MKKKFLLWLCKSLKVELVEPINQVNQVHYVHEVVPYTLIKDTVKLSTHSIPKQLLEEDINQIKAEMAIRCVKLLEKENLLRFDQFENPMTREINLRCSFFAAPHK